MVKNLLANAGAARDAGSIPGSGRPPEGGNGNPLQSSCLENPKNRETWWATVHGVAKSQTRLSMHTHTFSEYVYQYWSQEEKPFHCIISIDTEKASDKIKHPIMIKSLRKLGKELQLDKRHGENPTGDIILNKD